MSRKSGYNTTVQIRRLKNTEQDAVGGITQVPVAIFQTGCRIRQLNAQERFVGGKDGIVSTHRVYCDVVDIRNQDEATINGSVYDVNTINPLSSGRKGNKLEVDMTLRV